MSTRLLLCALLITACGKKATSPVIALSQADVDAANAAIPVDFRDKVTFELATIKDASGKRSFMLVAPRGWKPGSSPGTLVPPDPASLGTQTSLAVGTSDESIYRPYTTGQIPGNVLRDSRFGRERMLVFEHRPRTGASGYMITTWAARPNPDAPKQPITILKTWWDDSASTHYMCLVWLEPEAIELVPAFERVCGAISVVST